MQDYRKRGRKPREGEKGEKIDVICFKCPYTACDLQYQSSLGYKRHLMYYKHSLFAPSNKKIVCGYLDCPVTENIKEHICREHPEDATELLEAHEIMIKVGEETEELSTSGLIGDIVHDEGLLDISKVMEDNGVIKDIILATFPKGITHIINYETFTESNQVFYCRIPGCGRQFKSLMAYKYHCGKFTHLFKYIIDEYVSKHGPLDYEEIKNIFKKKFNLENRFLLEGISHHLMRMPDQHYNFIFTFDDTQLGHEKRRLKKRCLDSISEYAIGSEDRNEYDEEDIKRLKEDDAEEKPHFKVDSIVFNGRQLPHQQIYEQGRLSFINLYLEATLLAVVGDCVFVGTKGEIDEEEEQPEVGKGNNSVFSFSSGNAIFFVLDKNRIRHEISLEGFGYPRKLIAKNERCILVLFNDGTLREVSLTEDKKLEEVAVVQSKARIVDFTVFKEQVIICSHRVLTNLSTKKERPFESPIVSVSATSESILIVDSNGRTYCINGIFEDTCTIPSKVGTNIVSGLGDTHDLIFISNSLYGLGRIYSAASNSVFLVSPHACSNAMLIKPGFVVSSGLDGSLCVSAYNADPKVYMKVLRTEIRGDELFIATSEEEHALTENTHQPATTHDPRIAIQGIIKQGKDLVTVLACGIVIVIDRFFRE